MINKHTNEFTSDKILDFEESVKKIAELKTAGKKVGLCHGGFDLLHPGQMKHLESAKGLCDILFVSVTSDKFVTSRKGSGRPVFTDKLRAYSVACLGFVDFVVVTSFKKGIEVIENLKPTCYVKGPDYINKTTPGITAERKAIANVGGEMVYTNDPKLSTTEIITYIKNEVDRKRVLVGLDRDGTIIEFVDYLGREPNWKEKTKLLKPVVDFLIYLKTKFDATFVIVTNQSGVARKYFDCALVEEINGYVDSLLREEGIEISAWKYCPDADKEYVETQTAEFDQDFVKEKTKRKPSPEMFYDALKAINYKQEDFEQTLFLGDRDDDEMMAKAINAKYIDVNDKNYEELLLLL